MSAYTPCLDRFDSIVAHLRGQARNAARRGKPTMWAYYERMAERLEAHFAEAVAEVRSSQASPDSLRMLDGGIAGVALAIVQIADGRCSGLPRDAAADLWALSVYCARILAVWTPGPQPRRSLRWLRERAGVAG